MAAAFLCAPPAQATFPGKNGKIAFFNNDQNIYVVEPNGSNITKVTDDPASHPDPNWSADGKRIAYASLGYPLATPQGNIWYVNADGTRKTQVTENPDNETALGPAWSPDGTKIAFADLHGFCSPACYVTLDVVNADGTGKKTILGGDLNDRAFEPSWSPDGKRIVFTRSVSQNISVGLWTIEPDGSNPTRICCDGMNVGSPDWSPDGRTILFQSGRAYYRVNPDGTGLVQLYAQPAGAFVGKAAWSPDGTRIVFAQADDNRTEAPSIFTMKVDGTDRMRVTGPHSRPGGDGLPSWQPIPGPTRSDYKNAAQFCKAEQAFWGAQFASRYGGAANAYGKCVSQSHS